MRSASQGLTAVAGIRVGHDTLTSRPTGCTVILCEAGCVAGCDIRGGAPGTRETDLLAPTKTVNAIHGICLAGGSAFGLDAASGVMRYLEERGVGFDATCARVPIVPSAVLFDLPVGDAKIRPDAESGYRAAQAATTEPVQEGCVGAGAGATVGKVNGFGSGMKGGVGSASIELPDGLIVAALVVVNAEGDVVGPSGDVIAGVRTEDGQALADARKLLRAGIAGVSWGRSGSQENTTLAVVATNAPLTKSEATVVAQMAHDGFARAIVPSHGPNDGDATFALATGALGRPVPITIVGALAAELCAEAIVRAVRSATGVPGFPSAHDLSSLAAAE
jgi:L-aminopeptidase/D-esterase-like protein